MAQSHRANHVAACGSCRHIRADFVSRVNMVAVSRSVKRRFPLFEERRIFLCPCVKIFLPVSLSLGKSRFLFRKILDGFGVNIEKFIGIQAKVLFGLGNIGFSQRLSVHLGSSLFGRKFSDDRFKHNQTGFISTSLCLCNQFCNALNIIHIAF